MITFHVCPESGEQLISSLIEAPEDTVCAPGALAAALEQYRTSFGGWVYPPGIEVPIGVKPIGKVVAVDREGADPNFVAFTALLLPSKEWQNALSGIEDAPAGARFIGERPVVVVEWAGIARARAPETNVVLDAVVSYLRFGFFRAAPRDGEATPVTFEVPS